MLRLRGWIGIEELGCVYLRVGVCVQYGGENRISSYNVLFNSMIHNYTVGYNLMAKQKQQPSSRPAKKSTSSERSPRLSACTSRPSNANF